MFETAFDQELHQQLERLLPDQRYRVLDFVRALAARSQAGPSGQELLRFAGAIEPTDLETMTSAIEAGCEQVIPSDW